MTKSGKPPASPDTAEQAEIPGRYSADKLYDALREAFQNEELARKTAEAVVALVRSESEALKASLEPWALQRGQKDWCEASYLSSRLGVKPRFVYPVLEKAGYVKRKGRRFVPTRKAEGLYRIEGENGWDEWKREETVERVKADLAPLRPIDIEQKMKAEGRERAWEGSELVTSAEIGQRLKPPMSSTALNHFLEGMGYVVRVRSGWAATEKAAAMCVQMDGRSEKPRVLWRKAGFDEITSLVGKRGAQTR